MQNIDMTGKKSMKLELSVHTLELLPLSKRYRIWRVMKDAREEIRRVLKGGVYEASWKEEEKKDEGEVIDLTEESESEQLLRDIAGLSDSDLDMADEDTDNLEYACCEEHE